jgi:transcriptional regulator with XRE-family HTH domain
MTKLSELKKRWIRDPEFREEYREADAEYAIIETLIRARNEAKLSQAELAKKIGTTQSAIARLESGSISPSLSTLRRYAAATGTRLHMELLPEADGVR